MNKKEILDHFSHSDEERMLLARILELALECERKQFLVSGPFLTEAEQGFLLPALQKAGVPFCFYGGFEQAERKCPVFLPDYLTEDDVPASADAMGMRFFEISFVAFEKKDVLTHRDYLGAILGLGVKRETIGDLILHESSAQLPVLDPIGSFLCENLTEVGRLKADCHPVDSIWFEEPAFKEIHDTVASLRLDAVLSAAFSVSRSEASDAIHAGRVSLGGNVCEKTDAEVREGIKFSIRGKGKAILVSVDGLSQKGRIRLFIKRYI